MAETAAATDPQTSPAGSCLAETGILLILAFANGALALDRLAVNFLSPYIVAELSLSNAQLGLLSSAMSFTISGSGLLLSAVADRTGKRRQILIAALVLFSLFSASAGLATGFVMLVAARLALGAAEGPVLPLTQAFMAVNSHPGRRGFNMGAMQIGGAFLIGAVIGPVLAVAIAEPYGWRTAFFASAIPGLLSALLITLFVRNRVAVPEKSDLETAPAPRQVAIGASLAELMRNRNVMISAFIAGIFTAWLTVQNVFMPVTMIRENGFTTTEMGTVLGVAGFGGLAGGIIVPALSDRFGRKPMVVLSGLICVLAPVAMLTITGSPILLAIAMALGWLTVGCAPLVIAVIPGESASEGSFTTAVAVSLLSAELIGGVLTPPLAGLAADAWGLQAPFLIAILLALIVAAAGLLLEETAPRAR
jgi:MFS family permease